jgi:hypothetical protein
LARLVGKLSGNQCSGGFSGPPVDTLEQVRTGVGGQGDAGVPEPLRDHRKGHVRGDVDVSNAKFSDSTIDFGPPATGIQDQPLIGQTPCPMQ